ncbi:MAG: hypothetical protein MUF30_12900 [Burkholderiales bacterium]|nr:hypothetical protein [Burkholderiales bacterium]
MLAVEPATAALRALIDTARRARSRAANGFTGSERLEQLSLGGGHPITASAQEPPVSVQDSTSRLQDLPPVEALHEDLAPWVTRRPGRLPSLEHPLMTQSPYVPQLAGYMNAVYAAVRQQAEGLLARRAYGAWLDLHARDHQLRVLRDHAARIEHGDWWALLGDLYRRELPLLDTDGAWADALRTDKPQRARLMAPSEARALLAVPHSLTVWFPVDIKNRRLGVGVHVDEAAAWRHVEVVSHRTTSRGGLNVRGRVISKAAVLAATTARGALELLVDPAAAGI